MSGKGSMHDGHTSAHKIVGGREQATCKFRRMCQTQVFYKMNKSSDNNCDLSVI